MVGLTEAHAAPRIALHGVGRVTFVLLLQIVWQDGTAFDDDLRRLLGWLPRTEVRALVLKRAFNRRLIALRPASLAQQAQLNVSRSQQAHAFATQRAVFSGDYH